MNYTDTVGMVTDYAILWVCFICRFIPSFLKNVIFVAYLQQQRQFKRADISPFVYVTDRMAVPPAYSDLGKAAKDIFSKGYGFGIVKLDLKTKSQNGVEFNTSGSTNTDTGKAGGSLETKYKMKDLGLSLNQKWNTDNKLTTEVSVEDQLAQGLKLALDTSFVPNTAKKSGKLKTGYKRDFVNVSCDIDFEGPVVHSAAVLGYEGWLLGYQMAFDTAKSKLVQNNFALGYKAGDFQLHTNVNDGADYGGSVYQKVSDQLETAVTLAWTSGSNNTRFGVAAKYQLDKDASVSAKVNNASLIGVGYTQCLRPGVKLTLSALIDGKNFSTGGHKVGLGFELEA
uniref:Non-selective voltage-gated ion channel VDAC3 n=2 Tax=Cyprinus carpio TaxID=7962 RepID=A0A8C2FUF5_CYPCA